MGKRPPQPRTGSMLEEWEQGKKAKRTGSQMKREFQQNQDRLSGISPFEGPSSNLIVPLSPDLSYGMSIQSVQNYEADFADFCDEFDNIPVPMAGVEAETEQILARQESQGIMELVVEEVPDEMDERFRDLQPMVKNVVATATTGTKLDLHALTNKLGNVELNLSSRNRAMTKRMSNPKATVMVYSSGKMTIVGTRTIDDARIAGRRLARCMQKIGYPQMGFGSFTVRNMVATVFLNVSINLQAMISEYKAFCVHNPMVFSGVMLTLHEPKGVIVRVFENGSLIFFKCRSDADLQLAYKTICSIVVKFERRGVVPDLPTDVMRKIKKELRQPIKEE